MKNLPFDYSMVLMKDWLEQREMRKLGRADFLDRISDELRAPECRGVVIINFETPAAAKAFMENEDPESEAFCSGCDHRGGQCHFNWVSSSKQGLDAQLSLASSWVDTAPILRSGPVTPWRVPQWTPDDAAAAMVAAEIEEEEELQLYGPPQ